LWGDKMTLMEEVKGRIEALRERIKERKEEILGASNSPLSGNIVERARARIEEARSRVEAARPRILEKIRASPSPSPQAGTVAGEKPVTITVPEEKVAGE